MNHLHPLSLTGCAVALVLLTACEGLFEGIYDEAPTESKTVIPVTADSDTVSGRITISGTLYIDASSWTDWYYIDLQAMVDSVAAGKETDQNLPAYPIPTTLTGDGDGKTGIYTYWFDVWGKGISVNEYRSFMATDPQPAPKNWTFAVHRNNVRTNGGAVYETPHLQLDNLQLDNLQLDNLPFTPDEWTETAVWAVQAQMLNSLVGSQGIEINSILSSWLRLDIPPMPPAFTLNNHVFILRLNDNTYAALQLENYLSPKGTKCCLTINYKYPL
ncbi:MAG: HmuY family protein [Bacteroidaceae bacterium]|nr:HmuY family protein [Bacteroidaceae bacterium]